jgi:hypothetical protein
MTFIVFSALCTRKSHNQYATLLTPANASLGEYADVRICYVMLTMIVFSTLCAPKSHNSTLHTLQQTLRSVNTRMFASAMTTKKDNASAATSVAFRTTRRR